jgi:hypothetical protein
MNLMALKVIWRKACLRIRNPSRLSKDLGPEKKEESKEVKDSMKVENDSVHHKRYEGHA